MPVIRANGVGLYYEDTGGEGQPVVLIHGHSVDLRMWPAQTFALREAGYRVIRYDVRGHGRSEAPDAGYTWPVYAEDLRCLLDALDVGVAHLAGFSMGGGIALQFALDHPGRTRSLTLADAAVPGYAYSDDFATLVEALVDAVRARGWRAAADELWLVNPMFDALRRHPATFDVVRDMVLDFPAKDYFIDAPEPEGPEAIDRIGDLRPPLLVLVGAEDLEDFRLAAQLVAANAPRARLETVPGAGHMLPVERPGEFDRRLLAFLAAPEAYVAAAPAAPEPVARETDGRSATGGKALPPAEAPSRLSPGATHHAMEPGSARLAARRVAERGSAAPSPPSSPLQIRPARMEDARAIAAIDSTFSTDRVLMLDRRGAPPALTFDFTVETVSEGISSSNADGPEYWEGHLRDGDTVLVAELAGVIVGAIILEVWDFNRSLWVSDIRVTLAARRHGVGRALLDAAAALARKQGLVSLRLETQSDNVDAVLFYLRYGFRFSGFDDRLYLHLYPTPEQDNRIALFFTYPLNR